MAVRRSSLNNELIRYRLERINNLGYPWFISPCSKGSCVMSDREQPRRPRVQTSIAATLIDAHGGQLPVEVTDLSSGGFRLHTSWTLAPGSQVQLQVQPHGDFPAEILWVKGHEAGGRFLEPVTL